jgi:hypothetical protein
MAGLSAPAVVSTAAESVPETSVAVAADPAARVADAAAASRGGAAAPLAPQPPAANGAKPAAPKPAAAKPAAPKAAAKPAPPKAAKAAKKAAAPSSRQMHPRKIHAAQQKFKPSAEQMRNARAIVETGKKMGLPPRAWVIAVATALQESTLNNFGHLGDRNDHDSLGLFQQRPSAGWGAPKQLQNPTYASAQFYKALVQVSGWDQQQLTAAAQKVQVSAFPNHYAKWEVQAGYLVSAMHGEGPYAKLAK